MIDRARLKLQRPFLEIVEGWTIRQTDEEHRRWSEALANGEDGDDIGTKVPVFMVRCTLYPDIEEYGWGLVAFDFPTREEAEQYIADYGSDKHVAELREFWRRTNAQLRINSLKPLPF
jgi:hypothetical protein